MSKSAERWPSASGTPVQVDRNTDFFVVTTAAVTIAIMFAVGIVPCTSAGAIIVSHASGHR